MRRPTLIAVAPNGARKMPKDHEALPITPQQVAQCAAECLQAGAGMIHMHARDNYGRHCLDPNVNLRFVEAIKTALDDAMIIQLSTEAIGIFSPEQQIKLVRSVVPEATSIALRELIPDPAHPETAQVFFHWMREQQILCQYILYSPDEVRWYNRLIQEGVLPADGHHLLFVIGRDNVRLDEPLSKYVDALDHPVFWSVCAFGFREYAICKQAIDMGGDVRVGFENNCLDKDKQVAVNNAQLVAQIHEVLQQDQLSAYTAATFREAAWQQR